MKKTLLSFASVFIIAFAAQSQGLYFGGSVGYGFRAGSTTALGNNKNFDGSSDVVKTSLGAGFAPVLSVGYLFSENVGAELGLGYLVGTKTTFTDATPNNPSTTNISASSFFLNPSFVIRGGGDGKVVPYGKAGIFLGVGNTGTYDNNSTTINNSNVTKTTDDKTTFSGGIATGLTANFGVDFMLSDNLALFGELFGRLATWSPSSYTDVNTSTVTNSGNNSSSTSTTSIAGNYVDHTPANYIGTDQPASALPLSSIGLNIGIRYYLSK